MWKVFEHLNAYAYALFSQNYQAGAQRISTRQ